MLRSVRNVLPALTSIGLLAGCAPNPDEAIERLLSAMYPAGEPKPGQALKVIG